MTNQGIESDFLQYLVEHICEKPEDPQLPSLNTLSVILGISVAQLREKLEVAKALGLVEVRPRTGIKRLPYSFVPAVWQSLAYAVQINPTNFEKFSDLRKNIELAYWHEAIAVLRPEDIAYLDNLVNKAYTKLQGIPIHIPHSEHRELHLSIYKRLENPFVLGILESYWKAYESVGLSVFTDLQYLEAVWAYHRKIVNAIQRGDIEAGYQALAEHTDLIHHRSERSQT